MFSIDFYTLRDYDYYNWQAKAAPGPVLSRLLRLLSGVSFYPVYADADVVFYGGAAKGPASRLEAIRGAKQFVFIECPSIGDGGPFLPMKELLMQKMSMDMDVRLFCDEIGSAGLINKAFFNRWRPAKTGICAS